MDNISTNFLYFIFFPPFYTCPTNNSFAHILIFIHKNATVKTAAFFINYLPNPLSIISTISSFPILSREPSLAITVLR